MQKGDTLQGRYKLDARAGAGAVGIVFHATDMTNGRAVAVKLLRACDGESLGRFRREADVLVQLQHPCVVRYVAHGATAEGEPFLIMEWLDGESLKERMQRKPLDLVEIVDLAISVASALGAAHGRGIVHRDIKPANVFLVKGSASEVRVVDFGLARARDTGETLTATGDMVGTPAYMSPEQARGDRELGPPTDLFSLGALVFRSLAGFVPYEAADTLALLMRLASESAPPLARACPDAPPRLARLVDAMLSRDAAARGDAAFVHRELLAIRAELSTSTLPPDVPAPGRPSVTLIGRDPTESTVVTLAQPPPHARVPVSPSRLRAWAIAIALGAALLVAALGVTAIFLRRWNEHKAAPPSSSSASTKPAPSGSASTPADVAVGPLKIMNEISWYAPVGPVVSGGQLYFGRGCSGSIGEIAVLPTTGGTPKSLAKQQHGCGGVATTGGRVYWTTEDGKGQGSFLLSIPPTGGTPTTVASLPGGIDGMVYADDQGIVVSTHGLPSSLMTMGLVGESPKTLASARVNFMAVDAKNVYFSEFESLKAVPRAGGDTTLVTTERAIIDAIAVDDRNVYYSVRSTGSTPSSLSYVGKSGGAPTPITEARVGAVAADASGVYWVDVGASDSDGAVMWSRLDGPPVVLAANRPNPCRVAIDASYVYWIECGAKPSVKKGSPDGAIFRLPKPASKRQ